MTEKPPSATPSYQDLLALLPKSATSWIDDVSDRDIGLGILSSDYEAQLHAIHNLLSSNRDAEDAEVARLRELERQGREQPSERIADDRVDLLYNMTYQDASHSMAAVGLLAPFVESMFDQAFRYLERETKRQQSPPSSHDRWRYPADDQWDCRYEWRNGRRQRNVVRGILQLADALGMTAHFPTNLRNVLSALFAYRNMMFHSGLEWPLAERQRFSTRIQTESWSAWFSKAESDGRPWIYYMTRDFVDVCLNTVDAIIDGIGAYCRTR